MLEPAIMHHACFPTCLRPLLLTLALPGLSLPAHAEDWPQWRGPNRDGRSQQTDLLKKWPADGPPLAWKARTAGSGFSSISVSKGTIYTLGDLAAGCNVHALKETAGSQVCETRTGEAGGHRG